MLTSTGQWQRDHSIYTGLGGLALTHLRVGLHCRHARRDEAAAAERLRRALDVASACRRADPNSEMVSFFCGAPGAVAVMSVASAALATRRRKQEWASKGGTPPHRRACKRARAASPTSR